MAAQTKAVLDNGAAVLKAAGISFADVVASRIYITDQAAFQDMNKVYQTYFPTDPPARATVKALLTSRRLHRRDHDGRGEGRRNDRRSRRRTQTATPGTKNPNLSSAIRVGNRLYVSGILGNTADEQGRRERRRPPKRWRGSAGR